MTQTIEQLTARIAELEAENERLKVDRAKKQKESVTIFDVNCELRAQLAAEQLNNKRLREALEFLNARIVSMDLGGVVERALSLSASTEALDAYVAEKVKEYQERLADALAVLGADSQIEAEAVMLNYKKQVSTLTKQRDLAVDALDAIAGRRIFIDNLASNVDIAVMTLDAIKESEAK